MRLGIKFLVVLIIVGIVSAGAIAVISGVTMQGFVNSTRTSLIEREKTHLTQLSEEYAREIDDTLSDIASLVNSTADFVKDVYEEHLFIENVNKSLDGYYTAFFSGSLDANVDGGFRGNYKGAINGTLGGGIIQILGTPVEWTYVHGSFDGHIAGKLKVPEYLWVNGTYNGNTVSWHNITVDLNGDFKGEMNGAINGSINAHVENCWFDGVFNGHVNGTVTECNIMGAVDGKFSGTIDRKVEYLEKIFTNTADNSALIKWFYMGSPKREFFTNRHIEFLLASIGAIGYDCRMRTWYKMAESQRTLIWTPIYVDAGGAGLMFTVSKPVYSSDGSLLAIVSADITIASIIDYVSTIKVGSTGYAMLLASDGSLIAFPGLEKLQYNASAWLENVATENLKDTNNADLRMAIDEMIAGKTGCKRIAVKKPDTLKYSPANRTGVEYVAYAPVPITKWSLGVIIPEEEIVKIADDMQRSMENTIGTYYLIIGIIIVTVIIVSVVVGSYITKPIKHFTDVAERISKGDLNVDIEQSFLKRTDELGELAKSFERMLNSFKVMMKELEEKEEGAEHGEESKSD